MFFFRKPAIRQNHIEIHGPRGDIRKNMCSLIIVCVNCTLKWFYSLLVNFRLNILLSFHCKRVHHCHEVKGYFKALLLKNVMTVKRLTMECQWNLTWFIGDNLVATFSVVETLNEQVLSLKTRRWESKRLPRWRTGFQCGRFIRRSRDRFRLGQIQDTVFSMLILLFTTRECRKNRKKQFRTIRYLNFS